MFCTSCGNVIAPDQPVCSKCGNPTAVGMMYGGGMGRRVAEHYFVLGVLHAVYSVFIALAGIAMLFVSKLMFPWFLQMSPRNPPPPFIAPIVAFVGWIMIARAVAGIAAGIGLMQRAHWARMLALIMGFISLLSIPIGTALGIYTIWVLLSAGAEQEYNRLALQPH